MQYLAKCSPISTVDVLGRVKAQVNCLSRSSALVSHTKPPLDCTARKVPYLFTALAGILIPPLGLMT
jgi:hypothetical protein